MHRGQQGIVTLASIVLRQFWELR